MHKLRTAIVGVAWLVALLLVGTAAPAAAVPDPGDSPDGHFHIYKYSYWAGTHCSWYGDDRDWRYNSGGGGCNMNVNDWASSWWNNGYAGSLDAVNVREHINYGGADICVPRGTAAGTLGWWDNRASSHFWSDNC